MLGDFVTMYGCPPRESGLVVLLALRNPTAPSGAKGERAGFGVSLEANPKQGILKKRRRERHILLRERRFWGSKFVCDGVPLVHVAIEPAEGVLFLRKVVFRYPGDSSQKECCCVHLALVYRGYKRLSFHSWVLWTHKMSLLHA